jgi:hypothetical protein
VAEHLDADAVEKLDDGAKAPQKQNPAGAKAGFRKPMRHSMRKTLHAFF